MKKLFILVGAEQTLSWYEKPFLSLGLIRLFKQPEYTSLKDLLNKELERGIKVLFIYSSSLRRVGQSILYEIVYDYFFSLHPNLTFPSTVVLKQLVDQKLQFLREVPLRIFTLRTLKAYVENKDKLVSLKLNKEEEHKIKIMILSALREAIADGLIQY